MTFTLLPAVDVAGARVARSGRDDDDAPSPLAAALALQEAIAAVAPG